MNRFSHRVAASAPEVLFAKAVRRFRNSLGLRPGRCTARIVQLHAYSEHVVPRPADFGDEAIICGFWTLGEGADWTPPADLAEFLEAGLAPVYVGFGSIPSIDPAHVTRMVCAALERTGQRGIISTGGGGLEACAVSDAILCIEEAPHEWLFPRVAAVVHHGGSGTVAASLCAGKASVVCPKFGDQPFWARRLQALGAAPEPLPFRLLSAESLAVRLETVAAQPEYARRAGSIGQLLRREDGVARAVLEIERVLADRSAPR
ncbi:glycosyltransferase [Aureimonas sp. SA4125]|uniref:glycosyltransferase n=1 Tax=Aureimonas sp. SA4125 TaxID=2826993 RepID=UPI001CC5BC27|nr:glycosyltransferase [Aureimonas sp. SA4125]